MKPTLIILFATCLMLGCRGTPRVDVAGQEDVEGVHLKKVAQIQNTEAERIELVRIQSRRLVAQAEARAALAEKAHRTEDAELARMEAELIERRADARIELVQEMAADQMKKEDLKLATAKGRSEGPRQTKKWTALIGIR